MVLSQAERPRDGGRRSMSARALNRDSACSGLTPTTAGGLGLALGSSPAILRRYRLLDDVSRAGWIDLHAGTHRGRERDGSDVAALGGGWLGADQLVHHRRVVLQQAA